MKQQIKNFTRTLNPFSCLGREGKKNAAIDRDTSYETATISSQSSDDELFLQKSANEVDELMGGEKSYDDSRFLKRRNEPWTAEEIEEMKKLASGEVERLIKEVVPLRPFSCYCLNMEFYQLL